MKLKKKTKLKRKRNELKKEEASSTKSRLAMWCDHVFEKNYFFYYFNLLMLKINFKILKIYIFKK